MLFKVMHNDSQQCCSISYLHWIVLFYFLLYWIRGFSVPLKKEHKDNRRRGLRLRLKTPPRGSSGGGGGGGGGGPPPPQNPPDFLKHPPPPPTIPRQSTQLNLTHFAWVRLARFNFGEKKHCTIYVRLGKNTSEKI